MNGEREIRAVELAAGFQEPLSKQMRLARVAENPTEGGMSRGSLVLVVL